MEKIAIGCDHGGFRLKESIKRYLEGKGYAVEDFGVHSERPADYPPVGYRVAQGVRRKRFRRGIVICKTGIGMAIIANKVPGIRSAVCNTVAQAKTSRQHNDTNVLSLAAKYIHEMKGKRIVSVWLKTEALGGRHGRRVRQIGKLEKKR
jgi:ribose 5-phosphate isomerase B